MYTVRVISIFRFDVNVIIIRHLFSLDILYYTVKCSVPKVDIINNLLFIYIRIKFN